jgi:hypothetical protein
LPIGEGIFRVGVLGGTSLLDAINDLDMGRVKFVKRTIVLLTGDAFASGGGLGGILSIAFFRPILRYFENILFIEQVKFLLILGYLQPLSLS